MIPTHTGLAALLAALGLAFAGCSSKPAEEDTAIVTPSSDATKPAPPAAPAPTPDAKVQPKE